MNLGSTSKSLISEVSRILSSFEINHILIKPFKQKIINWRDLHILQIDNKYVIRYFDIIGSNNPKHITKFKIWKQFGFCPPHTNLEQRKEILDNKNVYDPSKYAGVAEPGQMRKFILYESINEVSG